ncbi:MAG: hypothetical protein AAGA30_08975 [Planctomycetota bacterium]
MNTPAHIGRDFLAATCETDHATRRSVYDKCRLLNNSLLQATRFELPDNLDTYAEKVATRAFAIVDSDVESLKREFSEEQIYELTWAAILGSADARHQRTLDLLEGN